jgi:hypothetical protein
MQQGHEEYEAINILFLNIEFNSLTHVRTLEVVD